MVRIWGRCCSGPLDTGHAPVVLKYGFLDKIYMEKGTNPQNMEFVNAKTIRVNKALNEVDIFALDFIKILEKYMDYVIVSGYVAILLGRNRGTDDVDIIIPKISKDQLKLLYKDLLEKGYWCLNSSDLEDMWDLLTSKHSIRFAIEPEVSPNIELKFLKDAYDQIALKNPLIIEINGNEKLRTSFLELQIAFKEEVLKSNKDIEDANHLRLVAEGHLNENLINDYKKQLKNR